ncbi:MAG: S-methyl-5-thioribose-1-phosphate isomerase [Proteobacteria bacterium]|nr:S-methyl-5-thioribose-1-phosphate isomerase [Pseudomonadota bacterium]
MIPAMDWKNEVFLLLDQRLLPNQVVYRECRTWNEVAEAIKEMVVRGAPAIGIAAAFGVALAALRAGAPGRIIPEIERAISGLRSTRPTARNLFWALERMEKIAKTSGAAPADLPPLLLDEARKILAEDIEANRRIGEFGNQVVPDPARILTHCNAGALATGGFGTALGVIRAAAASGKKIQVIADETRPLFQGARLTAWELKEEGLPVKVITDGAAGFFLSRREIDLIIVGADRISANGDTANKIGTYSLAVLAQAHQVPFYVAAPTSTIDLSLARGDLIPIEERPAGEVESWAGERIVPTGVPVGNPAFDVTPARLITAIITERGVVRPPLEEGIRRLF